VVIIVFLLLNDVYDKFLEIAVKGPHIYFAQLLLSLVYLLIFDNIPIDQALVGWDSFKNVENIDPLHHRMWSVPDQLEIPFDFLMDYFNKIYYRSLDGLLIGVDLVFERGQYLDNEGVQVIC